MNQMGRMAQTQTDIQGHQAPQLLQQYLANQRVGGPALVGMALDAVKQADPSGFALRETLAQKAAEGLRAGGGLTDAEAQRYRDDYRQAQVNRGFGTGLSDALDESAFMSAQRFNRDQARINNALQVLSGRTPMDFFGQVNQAGKIAPMQGQDVSGMLPMFMPSTGQLMGFGQAAYNQNAQNIANQNAMIQDQFRWGYANKSNPLQEDIMFGLQVGQGLGQIAGGAVGAAMGNPMGGMGMAGGMSNIAGAASGYGKGGAGAYSAGAGQMYAGPNNMALYSTQAAPYTGAW